MVGRRVNVREISAAALFLLSQVLYFIFSATSKAAPYQTTAGHGLLLITVPAGFAPVWLTERRLPAQGQQPMPAWARLLLGGATGLLLAVAVLFLNATALRDVQELPGTSLGTSQEPAVMGSHAVVRLDPGRRVPWGRASAGGKGAPVRALTGQGLRGLDRVRGAALVGAGGQSNDPSPETAPEDR